MLSCAFLCRIACSSASIARQAICKANLPRGENELDFHRCRGAPAVSRKGFACKSRRATIRLAKTSITKGAGDRGPSGAAQAPERDGARPSGHVGKIVRHWACPPSRALRANRERAAKGAFTGSLRAISAPVGPGGSPPSRWLWRIQVRRPSGEHPNLPAIAVSAAASL